MSKKLISLAIAVTMIFSLFAFSASSVESGGIGFRIVSDAAVGMQIGDTVTAKVYYVFPDDFDINTYLHQLSNVVIAYNSTYFTYKYTTNTFDGRTWGAAYAGIFKAASGVTHTTTIWNAASGRFTANDQAQGYSDCILVQQALDSGNLLGITPTSGFPVDPDCEVFTIQFTVKAPITDDTPKIGIPEGPIGAQTTTRKIVDGAAVTYTAGQYDLTEAIDNTRYVTSNFSATTKIRPNVGNSALVDLGFTGSFLTAGIPIAFTGGRATNVSAVGVELTINGVTNTYEDNFVYLNATSNGYLFRVALTGIPDTEYDTPIKARMFVTYNGVDYWSDYVTTTAGAHVDRLP
jgi:hypothetical protein